MNGKYIDFVPARRAQVKPQVKPQRILPEPKTEVRHEKVTAHAVSENEAIEMKADTFSIKSEATLGVVEDLNPKFVKTNVPKRPLSDQAYKVPNNPFINQASVTKRPLSKHVYAKKIEPVKEEEKGPVRIISKPEKDGKSGLVITIILTIILGAAAGTVAFLLLPK